jgi:hypothetical protein
VEYYAERENHLREKIRLQKETALQTKLGKNKKCSCGVADPNPNLFVNLVFRFTIFYLRMKFKSSLTSVKNFQATEKASSS